VVLFAYLFHDHAAVLPASPDGPEPLFWWDLLLPSVSAVLSRVDLPLARAAGSAWGVTLRIVRGGASGAGAAAAAAVLTVLAGLRRRGGG
jgi:hypothetical protein